MSQKSVSLFADADGAITADTANTPGTLAMRDVDGSIGFGPTTVTKIINTGTQTITPGGSTAAAGTTTGDAAILPSQTSAIYPTTGADGTKGVRVNVTDKVTGRTIMIGNGVSNQVLKVYPPTGGTINGAAADAAFSSASGKGVILCCLDQGTNAWLAW